MHVHACAYKHTHARMLTHTNTHREERLRRCTGKLGLSINSQGCQAVNATCWGKEAATGSEEDVIKTRCGKTKTGRLQRADWKSRQPGPSDSGLSPCPLGPSQSFFLNLPSRLSTQNPALLSKCGPAVGHAQEHTSTHVLVRACPDHRTPPSRLLFPGPLTAASLL